MLKKTFLLLAALLSVGGAAIAQNHEHNYVSYEAEVYVNGTRMTDQDIEVMEDHYGAAIPDGSYWYDPTSGALIPTHAERTEHGRDAQELSTVEQVALFLLVGAALSADNWHGASDYGDVGTGWYGDQSGYGWGSGDYGSVYSEVGNTRSTVASDGSGGYMFMSSDGTSWYSGQ